MRGMDVDDVHFIPKVTTTSTTPPTASTPASRLPNVLTSLDIPPAYLEEILRPRDPPKVTHDPPILLQPQKAPRQQNPSEGNPADHYFVDPPVLQQPQKEAPALKSPSGGPSLDHYTVEVKGNDHKTVWYNNTLMLNVATQNMSQDLHGLILDSSKGPDGIFSIGEGSGMGGDGMDKSRWRWGWWNEEPSDVQQRREEASTGPRFDRTLARKVVVQEGKTAVLACRVVDNNEKAVKMSVLS